MTDNNKEALTGEGDEEPSVENSRSPGAEEAEIARGDASKSPAEAVPNQSSSSNPEILHSPSNNQHVDYRLGSTVLEPVPEEKPDQQPTTLIKDNDQTTQHHSNQQQQQQHRGATMADCQSQIQQPQSHTPATFNIPESNASDVAPSECSSFYTHEMASQQLTKTESLSASQQVLLWLTRTSMSDVSGVSSVKNLVQSKVSRSTAVSRTGSDRMQRNFSTSGFEAGPASSMVAGPTSGAAGGPPMRKCETVIALSGMHSSASSTASNSRSNRKSHFHNSESGKRSPMSVLRNLAYRGGKSSSKFDHLQGKHQQHSQFRHSQTVTNRSNCESPFPGLRPTNRLRSGNSSVICSRCTSVMSVNNSRMASRCTSQLSLLAATRRLSRVSSNAGGFRPPTASASEKPAAVNKSESTALAEEGLLPKEPEVGCKICLLDYQSRDMVKLQECSCLFCKECMVQYLTFEIMEGAYEISCPDPACEKQGVFQFGEMERLVGKELIEKHKTFRLNTEVAMDANRAWCPKPGCNTICHICSTTPATPRTAVPTSVTCPKCSKEFCSSCSANWHSGMTCQEHGAKLVRQGLSSSNGIGSASTTDAILLLEGNENIKRCPMCGVPIERDAGCAQMMCKRCKHVFCWFCLESLDDDFLLRHYDSGECKGMLGHSRLSVLWHRAQVIGIFAGFVVLLLVASPLLLVAAPCIFCCRCKSCTELEDEFNEATKGMAGGPLAAAAGQNSPSKLSRSNSGIAIQMSKD